LGRKSIHSGKSNIATVAMSDEMNTPGGAFLLDRDCQVSASVKSGLMAVMATPAILTDFTLVFEGLSQRV
jgi:hypothetical protein